VLVSAPVLGRPDAAAAGQLGIVIAGPQSAIERCTPVISAISRRVFAAGDKPEHAAVVKLANGLVLGCAIEAMGEAFSLVRKYGVTPSVLYDVMVEGLFACTAYQGYGKIIAQESYSSVGFTAELGLKDTNLMMASADSARVPLPSLNTLRDHLLSVLAHGDGGKDWAIVAREQARAAGLP
jgi:3-hydroxyisobutyrate dehydrogenase-like beta-hydroxyacid dehydrogenase